MQGLVQAMQTQAHTQAALQAQLEAQHAQVPAQDHGGPSIMDRFKRMLPPSFKGESDPLLAESCMREIEKIFRAIRCADEDKVTLATYMLQRLTIAPWTRPLALPVGRRVRWSNTLKRRRLRRRDRQLPFSGKTRRRSRTRHHSDQQ
ncbi:hypothetical protein Taro_027826 [Colocasia esculenta]|uniref:Uncharacterized protein n=1 Tax=Colocasia esculenta TaxID=4460 RepID=A0A843VSI8_COLES|nr:hypothetical protein [Colocasia esculenta]